MEQFRLLSGTAVLTVLIWVSADQLLTETEELDITIALRTEPNSDLVLRFVEGSPSRFRITASGRQGDINNLRDQGRLELTIADAVLLTSDLGLQDLSLQERFRERGLVFAGCAVLRVQPAVAKVYVDRRISVEVPVVARFGNLGYAVEPRVDPDTVRVTIMQTIYDRVRSANPRIALDVETYLVDQPEDEPVRISGIPLQAVVESDVGTFPAEGVSPDTVSLRATLRRRWKTGTIQAVPIKLLGSGRVLNRFVIEFKNPNPPDTMSLKVVGPAGEVDKLVSGELKVFATISITGSAARSAGKYQFYEPQFDLPPSVRLAEDQITPKFDIRLVPRADAARESDDAN